jgi:hypothetical protein
MIEQNMSHNDTMVGRKERERERERERICPNDLLFFPFIPSHLQPVG